MKITYIFRHPSKEKSMERVFAPIIGLMKKQGNNVSCSFAWSFSPWPLAMLANMIRYAVKSYLGSGIYHITGDVQYFACWMNPNKTLLTIHDCVLLHNNEVNPWFRQLVYKLWYEKPLKNLKYITCISEATQQDLVSFFPWAKGKITVVPDSVGSEFVYSAKVFNEECPNILHVGTRNNKNLERVIEALDGLNCRLTIIGVLSDEQQRLLKEHNINYKNRFHISDADMVAEYQYADIISFPSLFEGFGMPIIEGQLTGRAILTSDREPMKSVAGEGALFVNPESVESIRQGFTTLMSDKAKRDHLIAAGTVNAKKYSIETVTKGYKTIYQRLLTHKR